MRGPDLRFGFGFGCTRNAERVMSVWAVANSSLSSWCNNVPIKPTGRHSECNRPYVLLQILHITNYYIYIYITCTCTRILFHIQFSPVPSGPVRSRPVQSSPAPLMYMYYTCTCSVRTYSRVSCRKQGNISSVH